MSKQRRIVLVVLSDTHAGHKLGLCNPATTLEDNTDRQIKKYHPTLSETQKFMWETYQWGKKEILKIADKDDIFIIHNGDPIHGKASFLETTSSRLSDQLLIAQANMDEWFQHKNVKKGWFTVGTGIHELGEGTAQILIADALNNKYPDKHINVVYHGELNIDGFLIDYAHHGPNSGSRKWLEGNELRYYLRSIMIKELMEGNIPPHLVLRGHYHTYVREFLEINGHPSWIVLLPGFTFKDDYTRRATKSEYKQGIGMIAFEIINGKLHDTYPFIKVVDIRTKEIA